jgi:hypothetical protein
MLSTHTSSPLTLQTKHPALFKTEHNQFLCSTKTFSFTQRPLKSLCGVTFIVVKFPSLSTPLSRPIHKTTLPLSSHLLPTTLQHWTSKRPSESCLRRDSIVSAKQSTTIALWCRLESSASLEILLRHPLYSFSMRGLGGVVDQGLGCLDNPSPRC